MKRSIVLLLEWDDPETGGKERAHSKIWSLEEYRALIQDSRDILNEYISQLEKNEMTMLSYGKSVVKRLDSALERIEHYK